MPTVTVDANGALNTDQFYKPYAKQNELHTSTCKNLLAIGGAGSGKSLFLLGEAMYVCMEYPGSACLLLRRDYPELERGLILDFKNTVPKELYHYNDQKHIATIAVLGDNGKPTGGESLLFFGHLQNASERSLSQYLSAAFVFIGIDELGQFSYNAWSFLSWRNRVNKGCRPNAEGYMPICRQAGATNPLGPGYGWIKTVWIEKKPVSQMGNTTKSRDGRFYQQKPNGEWICVFDPWDYKYVHSTVLDNPAQLEKDPDYINKLQKLPPAARAKALEGDLHSVAGSFFANFSQDRNVMSLPRDKESLIWEDWQPIWLGFDWGLAHHTAVFWNRRAKIKDPISGAWKSVVVTYREMIVNEMDYQTSKEAQAADLNYKQYLCREVWRRTPGPDENPKGTSEREMLKYIYLSPERFKRIDETSHTVAGELTKILRSMNMPPCLEANDAREDGAVMMYNMIDAGEWIILDSCPTLITAIETRIRDEAKLEDVLKTEDELDDAYDGARYGLLSMLKEKGKPEAVKLQEKLATIEDPTAKAIFAYQNMLKSQYEGQPLKPKIIPRWQQR